MSAKCPPWNFTMHHGSICCCRTRFWAFYFCDTGRLYCLLLWFWHTVIFYFCDTDIHLLSTFVALAYIYCLLQWHKYKFLLYYCDTGSGTHLFSISVTLLHTYFILLWHRQKKIILVFVTGTSSASVTPAHIYCLLPWHWYGTHYFLLDIGTHLFSASVTLAHIYFHLQRTEQQQIQQLLKLKSLLDWSTFWWTP